MTQATALAILQTGTNVFLTGEPGSGKTHLVNAYIKYLRGRGIRAAVTASTGIAATHLNGSTIHSWSGIGIRKTLTRHDLKQLADKERLAGKIRSTHVLIIDEISMLDAATLDVVDAVCMAVRGKAQPFGGLQVVVVGDFYQLPPVARPGEPPPRFAFTAASWQRANFHVCYLTEQHRQSDKTLSKVLTDIRGDAVSEQTLVHLTERRTAHHDDTTIPTKLYTHNTDVDRQNTDKLSKLSEESRTFRMTTKGPKPLVEQLIRGCLSPETLELKIGAAVMCTRNNPELGFVNGTLGTIVDFDEDDGYPVIKTREGRLITVPPMDWSIDEGDKVLAKLTQIPLRLAWAITVHKSQGMSLEAAVLDLSKSFAYGQGYVALSRVRTLQGLYLLGWNAHALKIDPQIHAQDQRMAEQSVATEQAWGAVSEPERQKQHEDFIRQCGGRLHRLKRDTSATAKSKPAAGMTNAEKLARLKEKYPQAYAPWTLADDEKLMKLHQESMTAKELAEVFQRQPSAIRSRLRHLGLQQ